MRDWALLPVVAPHDHAALPQPRGHLRPRQRLGPIQVCPVLCICWDGPCWLVYTLVYVWCIGLVCPNDCAYSFCH